MDPLFCAVKAPMFPLPDAPNPIEVLLFVHVKLAPEGVLVKDVAGTVSPSQSNSSGTMDTTGLAFTVIENKPTFPVHPFNVGVTAMFPLILAVVELLVVNERMLPLPEAASPIFVLEFVQLKVAPDGVLAKTIGVKVVPAQRLTLDILDTEGLG